MRVTQYHLFAAAAVLALLLLTGGAAAQQAQETTGAATKLGKAEVDQILKQAEDAANQTASMDGLRSSEKEKRPCRMMIFVVDRNGIIVGNGAMPDAWTGSVDIALGKARTAAFFSSDQNALTSRNIGELSQPGKPLWGIGNTNLGTGNTTQDPKRNCLVTFPGGVPLYRDGKLVGGIGVSGDGVDQDEAVAFAGAKGFLPGEEVGTVGVMTPKSVGKVE
jgi:uncharacterized protein GlcG (DUF336 family)